jgi:hypothetical protein
MEIKFNTGRQYTAQGQAIRAKLCADGSIIFADDSRGVDGRVAKPMVPVTLNNIRHLVMWAYDHNKTTRDHETWEYLMMRPAAQPDAANQGGATPGASSVLADELDDQDADVVEAFERSGPRSPEPAAWFTEETLAAIAVVALMQALWEDANGRRRDEEGKKPRTRRGYARLLSTVDCLAGPMSDRYRATALRDYFENETCPVR